MIVTWQWRTLFAINKLSCRQYFQAKRFETFCTLTVAMNLPVSLLFLMVAGLFISSSKISGNFNCFQVFNKHHFATLKVWYSLLNKLLCWKNYFTFRTTRTKTTQNLIRRIIMPNFDFSKSNTLLILSVSSNFALSYRLKE